MSEPGDEQSGHREDSQVKREAVISERTELETQSSPMIYGYKSKPGVFDELLGPDGAPRAHYLPFLKDVQKLGMPEFKRRIETSRRLVHEQGITYNVYGDARGNERPWQIDPVPFIISVKEWEKLEAGLIQRATLINQILVDVYSSQDLIRSGWLPPALVFGQPDFLRPCHGLKTPQDNPLLFYGVDLMRASDGRWWVISDRTQIPTGAGYALANRLVTSRVLPEPFRDENVQRLAGFFRQMQSSLARLAHRRTDDPRVVLLTPGPYNETYFEQAWLARYLGYMLVEGQDLTVRDDRVFLKTLSGLEPVDVILRRVDDDFCDPLELRGDSMLGVPGLVEALRAGNVAIANSLGSGLLQSPAFLPFLSGLCRHLLGEELQLPSVATWWCGQAKARRYVMDHLEDLFIKRAFRPFGRGASAGRKNGPQSLDKLRRAIEFHPYAFVGQERISLSNAPQWTEAGLRPQPVGLRVYLVAAEGGYKVMPGGLARIASDKDTHSISMQQGGSSKDTWVLSDRPVEEITLLQTSHTSIELRRGGNNLPSRMADNFYWLGRYAERGDASARLLRSSLLRMSSEGSAAAWQVLSPMFGALESQSQIVAIKNHPELKQNAEALEAEVMRAIFDPKRGGSLRNLADHLQRLAMILRHRTSNDLWRTLSQLNDLLTRPASAPHILPGEAVGVINQVLQGLAAFQGLARENMTRAQGWRFLDMGYRIERSLYLCSFLGAALRAAEADNPSVLEAVLEVCDSTITYRSRYNLMPNLAAVYDLVLLDDSNPRSLLFQLNQLVKHFDRLPREKEGALPSPGQRVLIQCVARLRLLDPRELCKPGQARHLSETLRVIDETRADMPRLSDAISASYFAHSSISSTSLGEER